MNDLAYQDVPYKDLIRVTGEGGEVGGASFMPVLDSYTSDPLFPVDYYTAMKTGYFNKVPIMTGTVINDGALFFPENEHLGGEDWKYGGPLLLGIKSSFNVSETTDEEIVQADLIKRFYMGKEGNLNGSLAEFGEMETDALFLSPDQKVAEFASRFVPVYNYR